MVIFIVFHVEEYVGTFYQGAFSTREKADLFIEQISGWDTENYYVEEVTLDTAWNGITQKQESY